MDLFTLLEVKSKMLSLQEKYDDPAFSWSILEEWVNGKIAEAKRILIEGEEREA